MTYSAVYTRTSVDIIKRALKLCRVVDPETPLDEKDRENGIDALNGFVKYLQTKGFNLWREQEAFLPLIKDRQQYFLGPDGDPAFDDDDFVLSELAADAVTSDVLISLTTLTNDVTGETITAAPSELDGYNPATSLQGWTFTDGTGAIVSDELVLTNTTGQARASYDIETTPNNTYILQADYKIGTDTGANFIIEDINGVITSTTLTADGTARLEFVARQKTTSFVFENQTSGGGLDNTLSSFDYIDKSKGDKIGIFLDDGDLFWTNVIYISPFEIAEGLPSDAAAGNTVYSYTNLVPRPLDVINTRYRDTIDSTDIPTTQWTRDRYFEQPDKDSAGTVTKWYYSPQLVKGILYVWQPASQKNSVLPFTYIRPIFVTSDNADETDFPSEWFDLLSFGTAYRLIAEYDVPNMATQAITSQYGEILDGALGYDNDSDTNIQIDYEGRR